MVRSAVRVAVAATLVLAAATGCGKASAQWVAGSGPSVTAEPTEEPSLEPTEEPSGPVVTLSVDGIGPYKRGISKLSALQGDDLVTAVQEFYPEECTGISTGIGTGDWTGKFTLYFRDDLLVAILTGTTQVHSPSGAHVGQDVSEVKKIYGARAVESAGLGETKVLTVSVNNDRKLVAHTSVDSTLVQAMFVQKGNQPNLVPHEGPACDPAQA